ncbi:SufB/sufD domain protein [Leptospira interrogans serovar Canicola]|nr:SufB/sufD domain protein [Leptospira interrogans serovar Canicola]
MNLVGLHPSVLKLLKFTNKNQCLLGDFFQTSNVDIDSYTHYIGSNQQKKKSWDEVDPEVLKSFERLGIPEHERKYLAGIEAMNDSETVYANVKKELTELGILFCDIDTAIREYPEIVKKISRNGCKCGR